MNFLLFSFFGEKSWKTWSRFIFFAVENFAFDVFNNLVANYLLLRKKELKFWLCSNYLLWLQCQCDKNMFQFSSKNAPFLSDLWENGYSHSTSWYFMQKLTEKIHPISCLWKYSNESEQIFGWMYKSKDFVESSNRLSY